uniref:Proheparin-binding EGF-like growth factor n=1 Tax=Esox lucius TaxID=8010 RepID=A0AAY5K8P5_ESOLU
MRFLQVAFMLVHALVVSRLVIGAAVDRFESERPRQHTAIIQLLDVLSDRRMESTNDVEGPVLADDEEDENNLDYSYEDEDEEEASSDYEIELPQVAFSRKPKDPSAILEAEMSEGKRMKGKGKKKSKGRGLKRNPCLKKYKDFCFHGTCHYLAEFKAPSCICHPSYSGERCHVYTQASEGRDMGGYNRTTALAVVAVVLSSLCLTIIGLLLALRSVLQP